MSITYQINGAYKTTLEFHKQRIQQCFLDEWYVIKNGMAYSRISVVIHWTLEDYPQLAYPDTPGIPARSTL